MAVWIAIISVAIPNSQNSNFFALGTVAVCSLIGIGIFLGYALIFSKEIVIDKYFKFKRLIDNIIGAIFGTIGLKLIFEKN
jgi:threonine/homoserine/homoserine lactone efflux protein